MTETGWLLERGDPPEYLAVGGGLWEWTTDASKALRLARRQDGDALAEIVDDAWRIVEHQWVRLDEADRLDEVEKLSQAIEGLRDCDGGITETDATIARTVLAALQPAMRQAAEAERERAARGSATYVHAADRATTGES